MKKTARKTEGIAEPAPLNLTYPQPDAELCQALELNQAEWLRRKRHLPWVEVQDEGDALRVFTPRGWPRNMIAHARFAPASAHRRVGEILERYVRHKVTCSWLVGPLTTPPNLGQCLRAHGFRCTAHDAGMACDLRMAAPALRTPKGVAIQAVGAPPTLLPLTTKFRELRHRGRSLLSCAEPNQAWNFAAHFNGRAVGETTLFVSAGVAGVYDVEVVEEFRRRGIGTALLAAALDHARSLGLFVAVLGATWMGEGMYARLGFRVICKLSFFKYGKSHHVKTADADQLERERR